MSAVLFPRKHARHAKPSKAGPILVAGGMTAAFAVTDAALVAGAASAGGKPAQFERLAQCESGGRWSINTGNGYYGGLQFNLGTWRGLGFGGYPHQASKATQIAAGQKLHSQRGWSPWPACSRKLNLSADDGNSSAGSEVAAAPTTPTATTTKRSTTPTRRTTAERVSRTRASKATREAAGKARAARIAQMRALTPVAGPRFDGHVLTLDDAASYRIAVKHWQRRMAARGWAIAADGHFGQQSAAVAKAFALDQGLKPADLGTVDQAVWSAAWTTPVKV